MIKRSTILFLLCCFFSLENLYAQGPCSPMNGNYTINSTVITGGTNFQTFNDLAGALTTCGVSDHVVVTVVDNSGPYNEQVKFNGIPGIGPNATVTINGNGETVTYLTTATYRHIIRLANQQHFTIRNLKIVRDNSATSGFMGIHLLGSATNVTIDSVEVDMGTSTSTLVGGIVASGDTASILAAGSYHNVSITNCKTSFGGYGVSVYGLTSDLSTNVDIKNNTLLDMSSNGVYLRETNGVEVSKNTIRIKGGNGIQLAQSANINGLIEKNVVSALSTTTTTVRGIYVFWNSSAQPHKVINNIVHQFNAPAATVYGISARTGGGLFYNNTVILDDNTATATGNTAGFYEEISSSGSVLMNNIFYVTRTSAGNKAGIILGSTTNISTGVTSNHNVFHIPSGNVVTKNSATPVHYATLSSWSTASGQDVNSFQTDPLFATGTAIPTSAVIDNGGVSLAAVVDDITGATRSTTPDPGAYEFPQVQNDAELVSIDQPVNNGCGNSAQDVIVTIRNNGTATLTSVPVTALITGSVTATLNTTYTGTLAMGATVSVQLGTINTLSGGTVAVEAYTALPGDQETNNDTLELTFTINAAPVANAGADTEICSGASDTLESASADTYLWSTGASTQTIIASPSVTTTYTLTVTDNGCSATDTVIVNVKSNPVLVTDTQVDVCEGESVVLNVTGADTYIWSTGSTSGSITVMPSDTTTYIVTGEQNGCSDTDTITVYTHTLPVVQISTIPSVICTTTPYFVLSGSPSGGVFTGAGISNDTLHVMNAGAAAGMDTPFEILYTVTDAFGCAGVDTVTTEISTCTDVMNSAAEVIAAYPNPFSEQVILTGNMSRSEILVYNVQGALVDVTITYTSDGAILSMPSIATGIYVVKIMSESGTQTLRMNKM